MKLPKLPIIKRKIAKFSNVEKDLHDRKIVLIASQGKLEEIASKWDWKGDLPYLIPGYKYAKLFYDLSNSFRTGQFEWEWYKTKKLPLAFEIKTARKAFRFPVNHPVDGVVYCSTELEPDLYVPVSGFHEYMYQAKMNAFIEMCSSLNAKEVRVIYAEENGKDITARVVGGIPTQSGMIEPDINIEYSKKKTIDTNIFYSFPQSSLPLKKYNKPWLNSEPSWLALQKMRLERDVTQSTADFSYSDEMGVTTEIVDKMSDLGVDIGGAFTEIQKRSFKFNVEFWPKK